jgi:sugar transferase (PEP-CTERM/EpsH1 system associated)
VNLLFLVHRIPFPPNKGDKIRSYHELRHLASRHRVHVGCFVDAAEDFAHVPALEQLAASVEAIPLDPRRARWRSLGALASRDPLSVRYFASGRLHRWVRDIVARERIDVVLAFSSPMWEFARDLGLPVIMDFCDVDSDKWRQYVERAPLPLRPVYAIEARRLRAYEESVLHGCAGATLVAARERALWSGLPGELLRKVHVVPNGVDLDFFAPGAGPRPAVDGNAIVFTGAMDYYANVDAVIWFANEILPRVQAVRPEARFWIVGSRPAAEVQALGNRPGITVTGFVDDVREYYARAAACVVPLRIARGIQNKLLEAMAMARPVVATHAAADGLEPGAAQAVRVADDPDAFARETLALLAAPAEAAALGGVARRYVEQVYRWERSLSALEDLLAQAARRGRAPAVTPVSGPRATVPSGV